MDDSSPIKTPDLLNDIHATTLEHGFNMASKIQTGSLLRFLCASKPAGRFLELGTGTGLATSWMLEGMDKDSHLISVDNDASLLDIAKHYLGNDPRVEFVLAEGIDVIKAQPAQSFDLIFADAWDGKYYHLEQTIGLLNKGGIYIIDDMLPQENWPDGHQDKADALIRTLEAHKDLHIVKMCWASGIIVGVMR